jgi:polyhydroxyalkanoate synthesis repressor PhaR
MLIKRYAGHRLYNTATLTYVTLEELSELILRGTRFVVHDAETGKDITREILDRLH